MIRAGVVVAVVLAVSTGGAVAQDALDGLSWLAGCWRHEAAGGEVVIDEHWMAPRGGTMLAVSRTVTGDRTLGHEFLRIEVRGDRTVFVANPSGQAETEFVRQPGEDTDLVFRNPDHDFPQAIRYRKVGADSLVAELSGPGEDGVRRVEFPMARVTCDNPGP